MVRNICNHYPIYQVPCGIHFWPRSLFPNAFSRLPFPFLYPHSSSVLVIQRPYLFRFPPETVKHADDSAEKDSNWNPLRRSDDPKSTSRRPRSSVSPLLTPSVFKSGVEKVPNDTWLDPRLKIPGGPINFLNARFFGQGGGAICSQDMRG